MTAEDFIEKLLSVPNMKATDLHFELENGYVKIGSISTVTTNMN